jgi:hypothetical protein
MARLKGSWVVRTRPSLTVLIVLGGLTLVVVLAEVQLVLETMAAGGATVADTDRDLWQWRAMICQPDGVDADLAERAIAQVRTKKPLPAEGCQLAVSGGGPVFVDESAEYVDSLDGGGRRFDERQRAGADGRFQIRAAVRPNAVVVA